MHYLRRMNITSRGYDEKARQIVRTSDIVWVYWTYRNKVPSVLIAETREKAKELIRRLNPCAAFYR